VLAHGHAHRGLVGLGTEATFEAARDAGLLGEEEARTLSDAHRLLNDIFQWQRLTIEGKFDTKSVPPAILKRLATAAGLPSAKALASHLGEVRGRVREIFERVLRS
jgi:glutamate-ammonia-ligase adenylyltransferase